MKRILVVLLFVAAASVAFSVSGQVYTRIMGGQSWENAPFQPRFYDSELWANGITPISDLRVGRQGTGVSINFDSFTLDYKLRRSINPADDPLGWEGGQYGLEDLGKNCGLNLAATSPGYLKFSGFKLGPVDFSIGLSWWTAEQTSTATASASDANWTNQSGGVSSGTMTASEAFNLVAFDLTYNFQAGDVRFHADPWNQVNIAYATGSDSKNVSGTVLNQSAVTALQNTGSDSYFGLVLPLNIDWSAGPFSLSVECKFMVTSQGETLGTQSLTATNTMTSGSLVYQEGAVLKLGYTVNELFGVFGDIGIIDLANISATVNSDTNMSDSTSVTSGYLVPIFFGISLSPAPVFTCNIGMGFMVPVGLQTVNTTTPNVSGGKTSTTTTTYSTIAQTEFDWYEMHGYYKPFINLGADTKFAGDWSAGVRFIVYLNSSAGTGDNGPYITLALNSGFNANPNNNSSTEYTSAAVSGNATMTAQTVNWLNFNNIPDWDPYGGSSAYLGYSKDNFSTKLWTGIGQTTYANTGTTGLLGMFAAIDVGIKF